jgi:hypothetical protein
VATAGSTGSGTRIAGKGLPSGNNPLHREAFVDLILIIAILLLIFGGVGAAVGFLTDIIWILIVIAVIVIIWRLIAGRRAV